MDRKKALDQLRLMQAWHEDFGDGPNADYDAICYAIGVIEAQPEELDTLIKALEQEHKKLLEMQKALKNVPDMNVGDTISRQAALDIAYKYCPDDDGTCSEAGKDLRNMLDEIEGLPPAEQNLSEEYAKAVRNWLVNYQIKCAELKGRYTPYEVIGWIVSDWRKENGI